MKIINMPTVCALLGISTERKSIDIFCPVCGKRHRKTLHIDLAKGVFRCARCDFSGNAVHLYALMTKGEDIRGDQAAYYETACRIEKILQEPNAVVIPKTAFSAQPEPKEVELASLETRDKTYNCFLEGLKLFENDHQNLLQRGLDERAIEENQYKSVPSYTLVHGELSAKGVQPECTPGFFQDESDQWRIHLCGQGFYIPVRALDAETGRGKIQGLQIRLQNGNVRYKWFSSVAKKGGTAAVGFTHFAGFPEEDVLLTEGPLKADIIRHFTRASVIGIPGVNAISQLGDLTAKLKRYGVRNCHIAFDMDMYTNPYVLKALKKLKQFLNEEGFSLKMVEWDRRYKGYDDYLVATRKSA